MPPSFGSRQQSQLISLKTLSLSSKLSTDNAFGFSRSAVQRSCRQMCSPSAHATGTGSAAPSSIPTLSQTTPVTQNIPLTNPLTAAKEFPPSYYDKTGKLMLKCLTLPELEQWCESIGEDPSKRAIQIWRWMYYDRQWIRSLDDASATEVTNGFSAVFRNKVRDIATLDGGLEIVSMHVAFDGTRKIVFKLTAGSGAGGQVETVLIPIVREAGTKQRVTLCVSSQVGCAMACQFCYTGRMGLLGNLTPGQITEQVVVARRILYEEDLANPDAPRHVTPITNIVFMGMGEPMDNLGAVLPSIEIMTEPLGLHLSYNKVCVSTVGLVDKIKEFAKSTKAVLAVSLHAATDEVRDAIVPVNKRYPLAELVGLLEELFPKDKAANRHGNHVCIEYTMLGGVNDRTEDVEALINLLRNVRCKINLIVFNPHDGTPFAASSPESVAAFRNQLIQGGHVATIRSSRGDDQMAACGQLGNPELSPKKPPLLYKKA
jgi:23S rRNA (adenine2503-C2)-methyltransferase